MFWKKVKAHVFQLPRPFAFPFFAASTLLGSVMAGGINRDTWLAVIACLLLTAGGHAGNSYWDYIFGLDSGEKEDRSAEKAYTGGQNLIANGVVSLPEVLLNSATWYLLALVPLFTISNQSQKWELQIILVVSLVIPLLYTFGKFTVWLHELSLGLGVGPVAVLLGAYAVNPNPPVVACLLVSVPAAIILSFLGLALDEWEDAEANLKKGVKSLAYKVWEYSDRIITLDLRDPHYLSTPVKSLTTLRWYCTAWLMFLCIYHVLLISLGVLKPLTALALVVVPVVMGLLLMLSGNFRRTMVILIAVAALYPVALLMGQIFG